MKSFVQTTRYSVTKTSRNVTSLDDSPPASASSMMPATQDSSTPLFEKFYRGLTSPLRLLPDFLLIGAQRSGTTSLYQYLQTHPSIGPASTKEVHYFDRRFNKSLAWYQGHFPTTIEKYHSQLLSGQPYLTGEATPCYLFYPHAPTRVAQTLPHARFIVLLRNPVDRAYSQYHHALDHGYATLSFEDAIEHEEERAARERKLILKDQYHYSVEYMERSYLSRGIYVDQLQTWMKLFSREQFLILKSEEFYTDPATTVRHVLDFLNIPTTESQLNKGAYLPYNNYTYAKMNPALRNRLLAYFEPHNARLYDFLGVDYGWDK